jgi:putative IMPACT (imprinted ancient) family translation regulator
MRALARCAHLARAALPRAPPCRRRLATRAHAAAAAAATADAADGYDTLAEEVTAELEAKKSRFIAHAAPAASPAAALSFIAARRDAAARHSAWAYRCGPGQFRSSDDGEPGGTAGRPILAAIEGAALDACVVVVVRWYGGIQLGTGGLTRGA